MMDRDGGKCTCLRIRWLLYNEYRFDGDIDLCGGNLRDSGF